MEIPKDYLQEMYSLSPSKFKVLHYLFDESYFSNRHPFPEVMCHYANIAEILGLHPRVISNQLDWLVENGYITLNKEHSPMLKTFVIDFECLEYR